MFSILCPHCGAKLAVEEQSQGQAITCLSCVQKLAVPVLRNSADSGVASIPQPLVETSSPSLARRRRQPAVGNRIISLTLHLSITAATIYAGYYLVSQSRTAVPQSKVVEVAELQAEPRIQAKPKPRPRLTPKPFVTAAVEPIVVEPEPTPVESAPRTSPFTDAPQAVSLPPCDSSASVILAEGVSNAQVQLLSNSAALSYDDGIFAWSEKPTSRHLSIATLAIDADKLNFCWSESVPATAEAAVRNSVVKLSASEFQHVVSLREAAIVNPVQIDLGKSSQRIVGKCPHLPPADEVCFELLDIEALPAATVDDGDLTYLQYQDQATLEYLESPGAATRLTLTKRGKVAVVEIESGYSLPSGDEQPMTISRGNSKLKQLATLYEEALAAEKAIGPLRDRLKDLQRDAKAVPRSRATATAKATQLQQLQVNSALVQRKIEYAQQLLAQKQAIVADYQAIQKVAKLAQQLHESSLSYRFFTVVDGHQVDLLITE